MRYSYDDGGLRYAFRDDALTEPPDTFSSRQTLSARKMSIYCTYEEVSAIPALSSPQHRKVKTLGLH